VSTAGQRTTSLKATAETTVERELGRLVELSHTIHANPETSFQETKAAAWTADVLEDSGFSVTRGAYDLPTSFVARAGHGPFVVALCAEYDALPEVGHACGHNIIAAASVGAGLALAEVADPADMTVVVVGTPAEEGGGGKITMLERGAFDGVHAAMMVHPWPTERLEARCLAVTHFDVTFTGLEAHASAAPWKGVNAADAMTLAQVALGLLRQQLRPNDQVHGVIREGGKAANIIPAHVVGRFMCRAASLADLAILEPRVRRCFEAAALATGAAVEFEELAPVYSHMHSDGALLGAYRANAEALGRHFDLDDAGDDPPSLSTDMANVSLAVPSIHPMIAIDSNGAVNHQHEFAAACTTPSADRALRDGAVGMAWTAIDAALTPELRAHLVSSADELRNA
jgi:amidohydrolase